MRDYSTSPHSQAESLELTQKLLNQKLLGGSVHTLMGVTKREPLMLESVTWLSSTAVMISSAPVMIAMSRLG